MPHDHIVDIHPNHERTRHGHMANTVAETGAVQ